MYKENASANLNQSIGGQKQTALPPVAPMPEVLLRVGEIEQNLLELHGVISVVSGRLEPVLQYPPISDVTEGKSMGGQSPLGDQLLRLNDQVLCATARLRDLLSRLEV